MAKTTIYLETSVISYLTSWPSRDIVREGHRQITRTWWDHHRAECDLFISQVVLDEISKGDPSAVADRLAAIEGIPLVEVNPTIASLATDLVQTHALPAKAIQDAFHIATAAHHQIDILWTWNCTHICNPHILHLVREHFAVLQVHMPEVTTPEALLGEPDDA